MSNISSIAQRVLAAIGASAMTAALFVSYFAVPHANTVAGAFA